MGRTKITIRDWAVPALLSAAAGVTLLAAGLLSIGGPADAGGIPGNSLASGAVLGPTPSSVVPSLPPVDASPSPATASPPSTRVATRIVIDALKIDLPIVAQPAGYPWCNVAMYLDDPRLGQPGSGLSTYLFAHARDGMFGPLYERITLGQGGGSKSLIGLPILVYTSDDHVYEYAITKIYPRVPVDTHFLDKPVAVKSDTLWLQTSTGSTADQPKLQVEATPFYDEAATHAAAHPKAHPIDCS